MDDKHHRYRVFVTWTDNTGSGTGRHDGYERAHRIDAAGKPAILGSSDAGFRGDPACWNPEELLVASLAACHQLWFLSLCADAGIIVTGYEDAAEGQMMEEADGAGRFTAVTLHPRVTLRDAADEARARTLHDRAHHMCFIARSVNFPVSCVPIFIRSGD